MRLYWNTNRIVQENLRFFLRKLLGFSYCAISYELLCLFGNFLPRVLNLVQEHISSFYQNPLTILDILQWGIKEDKIRGDFLFTMNKETTQWSFQETNLKSSALFICKKKMNTVIMLCPHLLINIYGIVSECPIITGCSKLVRVMKRRKSSPAEEIEVVLLSVSVRILIASLSLSRISAKVSTIQRR